MPFLSTTEQIIVVLSGVAFGGVFITVGVLIKKYKWYQLIAGYNTASEAVKKQYDIEGLAAHIGDGLATLGVIIIIEVVLLYFDQATLVLIGIGVFLFIVAIILIGRHKFMPARLAFAKARPDDAMHPYLNRLVPEKIFQRIKSGTKNWLIECMDCHHKRDFWETGGLRGGGVGEPRNWTYCPECEGWSWQKIRKKSQQEKRDLP